MLGLISNVCLVHEWRVEGYPCLEVITLELYPHIIMVIIKSILLKSLLRTLAILSPVL